ncbi:ribosome maturation factor RimM [Aliifodinibius salicampi]|uniref:Ribosome maturation factor RimM n=1 Tax=Fodinibius salicampi TaxID=1920655 RepID=A0ABT3Q2P2_9BACT|nr:ribosome maturation factor RimM [Fodinibius salicampi]MCW9714371.1 ribosome maturation factor RimM [Fodinibius salicampi]
MLESIEDQYQRIGYIARSHGVQGEVLIIPEMYAPTLFDTFDLVRIENARGDLTPARIESVRVQEKNNRLSFFVKFEHVTDRTQAEQLKQHAVFADRKKVEPFIDREESPVDIRSFTVQVNNYRIGTVKNIIDNPAHPILEVAMDGNEKLLIPYVDEYITAVDEKAQQIQCQNLDQLKGL